MKGERADFVSEIALKALSRYAQIRSLHCLLAYLESGRGRPSPTGPGAKLIISFK